MDEQLILNGTFYGRVKCTYGIVNDEKGQPIYTFTQRDCGKLLGGVPILIAQNIRVRNQIPALLTPDARQYFLGLCEEYGWYLAEDGTLQEIPNYIQEKYGERHPITRLYIDTNGELKKETIDPGKELSTKQKEQINKFWGTKHVKFYPKAIKLLPYISGEKEVYVRATNFKWEETDEFDERIEESQSKNNGKRKLGLIIAALSLLTSNL